MPTPAKPTLKSIRRIRHHQDERLLASDLNADMAYEAMLRRLHLRGLHDTWGVALGLRLVRGQDGKAALVKPGLAYDCLGRELLLANGFALQAPTRPAGYAGAALAFDLVVRYTDIVKDGSRSDGAAICPPPPSRGLAFRWAMAGPASHPASALLAKGIRLGEEVPLGRFILDPNDRLSSPDYRFRRTARPLLRPYLAFNTLQPAWQANYEQVDDKTSLLKLATFTAAIGAADGGFSQNTHYFVRLLSPDGLVSLMAGGKLFGPLTSINNPGPSGFSVRVSFGLLSANLQQQRDLLNDIDAAMASTRLLWLGAEPVAGCAPEFVQIIFDYAPLLTILQLQSMSAMAYFGI